MMDDSGKLNKEEALKTAHPQGTEALITAPRQGQGLEALITAPRPSEGGVPIPDSKDEKKAEKKNDKASASADVAPRLHSSNKPLIEGIKLEWSPTVQVLVRSGQETEGVGNMQHDAEVNRRLFWSKLTTIEFNGLDALRMARHN